MIDIALYAVEENTAHVVQRFFHPPPQKARPVRRDQLAADSIRMVAEIDQNNAVRALSVEAENIDALVHLTDRLDDIGVVDAGVCLNAAVLHPKAANEGNVRRTADSIAHARGTQIVQRIARRVRRTVQDKIEIFPL